MDLGLLNGNFAMDDREFILHSTPDGPSVFRDDKGVTHCTITSFQHADPDIERDPLSINRRLFGSDGIELFGTQEVIYVLVPDSTTRTADVISPSDLQHVLGLRLGAGREPKRLCTTLRPTLTAEPTGRKSLHYSGNGLRVPSLPQSDPGEYVTTSARGPHRKPVLLALPSFYMPVMVQFGAKRKKTTWKESTVSVKDRDAHFMSV